MTLFEIFVCVCVVRFKVTHVLSDEPTWDGLQGRICLDHIKKFVPLPQGTTGKATASDANDSNSTRSVDIFGSQEKSCESL